MLEPGTSDIGTAVGSYSVIHISHDRVQLSHIFCISERADRKKAVTVFGSRGQKPRVFVRSLELSELCLLMCPSPPCGQLPAWAQFWVDKVMPLTLHLACFGICVGQLGAPGFTFF